QHTRLPFSRFLDSAAVMLRLHCSQTNASAPQSCRPENQATAPGISKTEDSLGRQDQRWTLRFSADVLPLFGTSSYSTICPSFRPLRPAFSTAEIWTNTSFCPPS